MDDSNLTPYFDLEGMREYMARLSPPRTAIVQHILQRKEKFDIEGVKSVTSFGPGAGDLDVELLSALPQCRRYIGVEMDARNVALLQNTMGTQFPQIKSTVVQGRAELWEGPEDQVDLIFLAHLLYNIPRLSELLQRVVAWIRPGGFLITLHIDQDTRWNDSTLLSGARLFSEKSHPTQTDLLREFRKLKQVRVEDVITNPCTLDIRLPNLHLANFIMEKECSTEEMHQLFEHLKAYAESDNGRIPAGETLTILVKDA